MRCIYSLRQSYRLILPKLFYLQTSVKFQWSNIGHQASCLDMLEFGLDIHVHVLVLV